MKTITNEFFKKELDSLTNYYRIYSKVRLLFIGD